MGPPRRGSGDLATQLRDRPHRSGFLGRMVNRPGTDRRRATAVAVGVGIIGLYVALASWSSHLSPLARGPLLDGLAPTNYRWVDPPPELASTNQEPSSGVFQLALGRDGVEGSVVFTSDNQVTVIVATG